MLQNATPLRKSPPLTHPTHVSLVLDLQREMRLSRSPSSVPRLETLLKLPQDPHVLLTFDKVHSPLRPSTRPNMWCF